jgi:hypothetical protein
MKIRGRKADGGIAKLGAHWVSAQRFALPCASNDPKRSNHGLLNAPVR